jgi:hypothetical protein
MVKCHFNVSQPALANALALQGTPDVYASVRFKDKLLVSVSVYGSAVRLVVEGMLLFF